MRKVLAIDGGGIKGVFPAAFLANIEEHLEGDLWEYFDLIAGTSTGGIIALGLGLGLTAREILGIYKDNAEKIFPRTAWYDKFKLKKTIPGLLKQKYETSQLADILRDKFRDKRLGDSKTRLMILSTNLTSGGVRVFKTAHHERFRNDYKVAAKEVALATSAAPIFFKPHTMPGGQPLVDGALWGNNPSGFATIEAISVLGWAPEDTAVLSLGCTEEPAEFAKLAGKNPGIADWGLGIFQSFMTAQSSASIGMTKLILCDEQGDRSPRISPMTPSKLFSLDGCDTVDQLAGFGDSQAIIEFPKVKKTFFSSKAPIFTPIYN